MNFFIYMIFHSRRTKQSGQVLVEFALIIGVLLFILFSMLVVGYWMSAQQIVTSAARQGAREASLTLDEGLARGRVQAVMKSIDALNTASVIIDLADKKRGSATVVTITYDMPFTFGNVNATTGGKFKTVRASSTARIECVIAQSATSCPPVKE